MKSNNILQKTTSENKIKEITDFSSHGIILISEKAQQEVFINSGELAKINEFQTHYWFLNFRHIEEDGSILDIAIPTTYFNYKQTVSGAHIDFHMKDVAELSQKVLPVHNMKVNELISSGIQKKLEEYFGVSFTAMSVDIGSIHRHPGSSNRQMFSGTDLAKSPDDHGVVYPFGSAVDNKPNFAGIMAIDEGECKVAHYEYRTANGTLGEDIEYVKGRCCAIVYKDGEGDNFSSVEKMFIVPTNNYSKESASLLSEQIKSDLAKMLLDIKYVPFTGTVRQENLIQKIYKSYNSNIFTDTANKKDIKYKQLFLPGLEPELPSAYTKEDLQKMGVEKLLSHLNELDLYYYETVDISASGEYDDYSEEDLIRSIEEMYVLIAEENQEDIGEVEQMIEELVAYGASRNKLLAASNEQIKDWYGKF